MAALVIAGSASCSNAQGLIGALRKCRISAINDDCCRENLCSVADTSISGTRVARELGPVGGLYGKPGCIVTENSIELTSRAILNGLARTKSSGVTLI